MAALSPLFYSIKHNQTANLELSTAKCTRFCEITTPFDFPRAVIQSIHHFQRSRVRVIGLRTKLTCQSFGADTWPCDFDVLWFYVTALVLTCAVALWE